MSHTVTLEQQEDFRFAIDFGDAIPPLQADEAPPLGKGAGPTPDQLLAAAVGNCLSDSLLFALRKFKQKPDPIKTAVVATIDRARPAVADNVQTIQRYRTPADRFVCVGLRRSGL